MLREVPSTGMLSRLADDLHGRGITLKVARANRPLREKLTRIGLGQSVGETSLFPSVHAAIEAFRRSRPDAS